MTEDIMNKTGLAGLPTEVLSEIIRSLLDEITTNKRSGRPHDYSTRDYRCATAQATKALVTLSLVSRRLREAATISLYRRVTLVPRRLPGSPIASEAPPHDSVVPLTLFLRTLVERPDLQPLVQSLDCQFFLRHAESTIANEDNPASAPRYQKAFEFHKHIIESTKRSPLSQEDLILKHVAATNHGRVNDTSERALAAILCLTPELRALSLAPLPAMKWLLTTASNREFFALQHEYHYHTLVSLVESARQSKICPGALQHLQAVRFTALFGFKAFGGLEDVAHSEVEDDPTRRHCAGYTFPLCSCLKLLLGPNITEFEADAVDKYHPGNFRDPKVPIHCSIKRAYFTISAPLHVLNHVGHAWIYLPSAYDLLWWDCFQKKGCSLKELDIAHVEGYEQPSHRLSSLPLLEALEHLCIGIPLLPDHFSESPLHSLLPPNLKTLRLHDWFTVKYYDKYHPSLDHLEMTEDEVEDGLKPLVKFQIEFSTALRSFSQICGNTHPHLRSLQIFGFLPMEKVSFDLAMSKDEKTKDDYFQALREIDLDGPEPGQVVRSGMEIQGLFAQAGVDFEELLHTQEFHYPFRAQVSRYQ
ncbi:unnamed protein product [Clonostachys byssicola]|uniref:Uncharacterized protein n=1 Tax=Clonostachys byssicola TaxID=160290 RepID=A0A9N9UNH1_9HYPO|nr:unnamed protein product [Clonostachys byssicola]